MSGQILLRRAASILIAVGMVLTSFTGILVFAGGHQGMALESNVSRDGEGDWYIGEDYTVATKYVNGDWPLTGSLIIRSGGLVVIENGILEFSQEYYPGITDHKEYVLIVEDGGKLVLRNTTLRTDINNLYDFPSLGMIVRNGGIFEAYDSTIMAPGHLVVDDSTFNLTRSVIKGNPLVERYCAPDVYPAGTFDDSMVLLFMSSEVNLFDSRIEGVYEPDHEQEEPTPLSVYNHYYPFAQDVNDAENNRSAVKYTLLRMPSSVGDGDTTGQSLINITADDLKMYEVGPNELMELSGFDTAGLMFQPGEATLTLHVQYTTTSDFSPNSNIEVYYGNGQSPIGEIALTATDSSLTSDYSLPAMSAQDLYNLNVAYQNGAGTLFINRIWVSVELTLPTYGNVTVAGNSDFTAVDTYIGVDSSDDPLKHNQLVLMDSAQAYLYGVFIDEKQEASLPNKRTPAFVAVEETFHVTAGAKGADDDTGASISSIVSSEDMAYYLVESHEKMAIGNFNTSVARGAITNAELFVSYRLPGSAVAQDNYIQWAIEGSPDFPLSNTGIKPGESLVFVTESYNLYTMGLNDINLMNGLILQFVNGDDVNSVQFDKIWVDVTISPTFYIYRWADFAVQDGYGQPVDGASVSANVQSTERGAYYYTPEGVSSNPPASVLQYLGKSVDDYAVTGIDGKARVPYLSEIINADRFNPYVNLTYSALVSYSNPLWGLHEARLNVAFDTYPTMGEWSASKGFPVVLGTLFMELPDLVVSPEDISFRPGYIVAGDTVTAHVYVRNNGSMDAYDVRVDAYAEGVFLGSDVISVMASSSEYASISWKVSQVGTYPVVIRVNADRAIQESNYTNSETFKNITVDIPVSGNDFVVGGSEVPAITIYAPFGVPSNIRVIENGTLTIDGGILSLVNNASKPFTISISENATLELVNGATLTSDRSTTLFLNEDARLVVSGSSITNMVNITAEGRSTIEIESSTIDAEVSAPISSQASVLAEDTVFGQAWTGFGGDATAELTNCSVPSLAVKQNAVISVYRWLIVTVWDGSGQSGKPDHVLPGASVTMAYPINEPSLTGTTYDSGKAVFRALCSELRANGVQRNTGGALVNTTYWYNGVAYEGDHRWSVMLNGYSAPLMQGDVHAELKVSAAQPDLDPPLVVSNDQPARGQDITISTTIVNNGVVDAYNVRVWFTDATTNARILDYVIPVVPKGGEGVDVSTTWKATYPIGTHNLTLVVDPLDEINEENEDDNEAYRLITVRGIADLLVQRSGVTFSPASPAVEQQNTITVTVWNNGDIPAENVTVRVYATAPGGVEALVGMSNIANLDNGESQTAQVTWVPGANGAHIIRIVADEAGSIEDIDRNNNEISFEQTVLNFPDLRVNNILITPASPVVTNQDIVVTALVQNIGQTAASNIVVNFYFDTVSEGTLFYQATIESLLPGNSAEAEGYATVVLNEDIASEVHTIIVVVNPDRLIKETNYNNNEGVQYLTVEENRPDIEFPGEIVVTRGGNPVSKASVGETVVITTEALNSGYSPVYGALIVFYVVDEDGIAIPLGSAVKDIGIGQTVEVSLSWVVNVTMGNYSLVINANPDRTVEESDITNDQISVGFVVDAPNPRITIDGFPSTPFVPGNEVVITGKVVNQNNSGPIKGALVTIYLAKDGVPLSDPVTGTTGTDGTFAIRLYLKTGLDGSYVVHVTASIGGKEQSASQSIQVKPVAEGGIPWYIYLLILALVSAVIIGFSAYLYKYGLGKMVECGECGALIPEASKRCPKCGVQFEPGTAKCSECNAWIPSNSSRCPECGTKFITDAIEEEEDAYIKRMREQYESYVDTFREEAKRTMGKKYSDAKFLEWWKKQPAYISFEQWLSQEEQKLKSGGSLCPICGTHNPRGSPVCQKCGSNLEVPKAEPEPPAQPEPKKPLRRIVRRPVDKKEAPKAEDAPAAPPEEPKP